MYFFLLDLNIVLSLINIKNKGNLYEKENIKDAKKNNIV